MIHGKPTGVSYIPPPLAGAFANSRKRPDHTKYGNIRMTDAKPTTESHIDNGENGDPKGPDKRNIDPNDKRNLPAAQKPTLRAQQTKTVETNKTKKKKRFDNRLNQNDEKSARLRRYA